MSTLITFKDGKSYETKGVYGGKETYQASQRDTLDIVIPADKITLEEAKVIWQNADATSEITINYTDEDGNAQTGVHINYTLPMALTLDTLNGVEVVHIKLAQKSTLELVLEQHGDDISALDAAILEIGKLLGGDGND